MNYELAKRLKDSGFPQEGQHELAYGGSKENGTYWEAKIPTLSELIEACNPKNGFALGYIYTIASWEATGNKKEFNGFSRHRVTGNTSEEAVANLWLELNKK